MPGFWIRKFEIRCPDFVRFFKKKCQDLPGPDMFGKNYGRLSINSLTIYYNVRMFQKKNQYDYELIDLWKHIQLLTEEITNDQPNELQKAKLQFIRCALPSRQIASEHSIWTTLNIEIMNLFIINFAEYEEQAEFQPQHLKNRNSCYLCIIIPVCCMVDMLFDSFIYNKIVLFWFYIIVHYLELNWMLLIWLSL